MRGHGPQHGAGLADVTGGAGTLKRAIAAAPAGAGHDFLLTDRDPAVADAARDVGGRHLACDIAAEAGRAELIGAARNPRVLVNCARIGAVIPFARTGPALWDRVIAVNLAAPMVPSQAIAPAMTRAGGGTIVNVASASGIRASAGRTACGASKAALIHLRRQLAVDLAPDANAVNAVSPGPVRGPPADGNRPPEQVAEHPAAIPQHRDAGSGMVASAVAFLAGPGARQAAGRCRGVDGGRLAAGIGIADARALPAGAPHA